MVQELAAFPDVFVHDTESNSVEINPHLKTSEERTKAVAGKMSVKA